MKLWNCLMRTYMINSRRANRNKMSQTKTTDDSGLSYRDAKIFDFNELTKFCIAMVEKF
jgi:hypothetical protein